MECIWHENKAQMGSAVNLETQPFPLGITPIATFSDCSFLNNTNVDSKRLNKPWPNGIGTLYSDNVPIVFSGNCNFSYNKGTAVTGSATFFILANNSVTRFDANTGNNRGAIALLGNTHIIFTQSTTLWFTNNKARSKGGGVYFVLSNERENISSQKCFVFYNDGSANQCQWNVSMYFENNSDPCNKSIYATAILPCVGENFSGETQVNSASLSSLLNETFHFVNSSVSIRNNTMRDAINIIASEHDPAEVPPGMLHKFKVVSHDELSNTIEPVFIVQT